MPRILIRLSTSACLMLALAGIARAEPVAYALDPVHTRILVAVDHAGFSTALGTISGSTGTLHFTPGDWSGARVEVQIPLQRLDFGDEAWNRATLARNLLDAEDHPVATFSSTRVEPLDERRAIVHGLLELRGMSREVALQVELNGARRHPLPPFRRTVGFSATATLARSDFGITAWRSMIGDTVQLRIEAEATRTRVAAEDGTDADDAQAPDAPAPEDDADDDAEPTPIPEPEPEP
ncbi:MULTISPECIES: YceI family protein [unclassified Luteimonas]